jgi:hypothetical protein
MMKAFSHSTATFIAFQMLASQNEGILAMNARMIAIVR